MADVEGVDFTLPPDDPENARVLAATRRTAAAADVVVGLAGWGDRGFLGVLYPPGTKSGDFLGRYARAMTGIELNTTYYGVSRERIERWAAAVPDDFRFCPKLPGAITHELELRNADVAMGEFVEALGSFGPKLGRAWGVLGPAFGPERMGDLAAFVERWAPSAPLAFELRHEAWFASARMRQEVFACFEANGVVAVLTDVAGRRDALHMRLTAGEVLLRFVGNEPHPSDGTRIADWVERLAGWSEAGLERAWVFLHQRRDPRAVGLARELATGWAARTGEELLPGLRETACDPPMRQAELF